MPVDSDPRSWPTLNYEDQHYAMLLLESAAREEEESIKICSTVNAGDTWCQAMIEVSKLRIEALRVAIAVLNVARNLPVPSTPPPGAQGAFC